MIVTDFVTELQKQVNELKADAERYRAIRDRVVLVESGNAGISFVWNVEFDKDSRDAKRLDAAIDKAIQEARDN